MTVHARIASCMIGLVGGAAMAGWLFLSVLGFSISPDCRFRVVSLNNSPKSEWSAQTIEMICSTTFGDTLDRYVSIGTVEGNDWPWMVLHLDGPLSRPGKLVVSWQGSEGRGE